MSGGQEFVSNMREISLPSGDANLRILRLGSLIEIDEIDGDSNLAFWAEDWPALKQAIETVLEKK